MAPASKPRFRHGLQPPCNADETMRHSQPGVAAAQSALQRPRAGAGTCGRTPTAIGMTDRAPSPDRIRRMIDVFVV
ncbi:hypothetical protein C6T66_27340 [Burkholderia multivorans]|uniref:Uncharacterized protein n=1 Tax=Burkholderia multivorans TaxID=87883 RepID=A0A8E2RW24_9BURK|nr:hypothetical protein C6P98_12680 [Burkholderia multivorans]PRG80708.1 hypothetical protein C6T66_27340 [Burkholderia multivorans]PRH08787.1 hypothetical protein C6T60_06970 [Burkholderia multivorans]